MISTLLLPNVLRGDACIIRLNAPSLKDIADNCEQAAEHIRSLEVELALLKQAYGAAVLELQRLGVKEVSLTIHPASDAEQQLSAAKRELGELRGDFTRVLWALDRANAALRELKPMPPIFQDGKSWQERHADALADAAIKEEKRG